MTLTESNVVGFLRYIADPSRDFDHDQFDTCLDWAQRGGYVTVQSKGQIMLTPHGRLRLQVASRPMTDGQDAGSRA